VLSRCFRICGRVVTSERQKFARFLLLDRLVPDRQQMFETVSFLRYLSSPLPRKNSSRIIQSSTGDDRAVPLAIWYANNPDDVVEFEKQMRRKVTLEQHFQLGTARRTANC